MNGCDCGAMDDEACAFVGGCVRLAKLTRARLIAAAPELLANLTNLQRAYVNLLETGRDKIIALGGECDPVDVMERNDPYLKDSRAAIKKATGE
jgi:hypothetical protein